jgi:methyl-accepting chemotaxis protein
LQSNMAANFTAVFADLSSIDSNVTWLRDNVFTKVEAGANFTEVWSRFGNVDANLTQIEAFCSNSVTNNSRLCADTAWVRARLVDGNTTYLNAMKSLSEEINQTAHSTYDYMTGTLAGNINSVLGALGVINATANRIEQNTVTINSTVSSIKQNQEEQVHMSVYSG